VPGYPNANLRPSASGTLALFCIHNARVTAEMPVRLCRWNGLFLSVCGNNKRTHRKQHDMQCCVQAEVNDRTASLTLARRRFGRVCISFTCPCRALFWLHP